MPRQALNRQRQNLPQNQPKYAGKCSKIWSQSKNQTSRLSRPNFRKAK
jgi:hypothetical protein